MLTTPRTLSTTPVKNGASAITAGTRLRVLQLGKYYPPEHGGMENHLHVLCNELRDAVDLSVVVSSKTRRITKETVDGIPVTRLSTLVDFFGAPVCPSMVQALRT